MGELLSILLGALLVNNFVLAQFLGLCPFMGVSRKLESALGMAAATTFVLTISSACSYLVDTYLLAPLDLAVGPFATVRHEDYLLWLQLWQANPRLRYGCLPEILAFHRRHEANLTAQRWRSLMWTYRLYRCAGASKIAAMAGSGRAAAIAMYRAVVERL